MAPIKWCRTCEICKKRYCRSNGKKRKLMTRFPANEDRCRQWVKIIGNEDLAYIPIEKLHKIKYVCGDHFASRDFNKKRSRLKKWAVPSLFINVRPLPDHLLANFPCHIAKSEEEENEKLISSEIVTQENYAHKNRVFMDITNRTQSNNSGKSAVEVHVERDPNYYDLQSHENHQDSPVSALSSSTVTKSTVQVHAIEHDHNYDLQSQDGKQDYPVSALSSSTVTKSTVQVHAIEHDHNYDLQSQDGKQDYPVSALSSSTVTKSTVQVHAIEHDHNYDLQSQDGKQDYPALSSSAVKISAGEVNAVKHDHNDLQLRSKNQACSDITPRERKLLKKLQTCKIKLRTLQKKIHIIDKIESPVLKTLITSTVRNQNRKRQSRRWSNTEKGLAVSIYKKSPKAYRFLRHILPLPSVRTLQTVLQKMTLEPGVNDVLLKYLNKAAQNLNDDDKHCVILFDEMALKKRLILNIAKDKIEGFEDLGEEGRTNRVANHALVFMIQGIRKKYKQPLAHYFVHGTISTEKLTVLLKNVIRKVTAQGFTVIATVCDQGPTNIGALNLLKRFSGINAESNYFTLGVRKIYIIYDVPHLFKSIRNNFLNAGEVQWEHKKAKWRHLIRLEEKNRETLHFTKITKRAVEPKFKGKMKVKLAAQILSNTVAAILKLQAESSNDPDKKELIESAEVIQDFDRLFDLTNGPASYKDIKKNSRENVRKNSFHHDKWRIYKDKLKTLTFLKNGQPLKNVRCVKGYLTTLTSLQDIWHYVDTQGMKYLNLRQLNQDSLENLFGLIRQHSPTNRNPTCHHFAAAVKSSILTRLSTPVSRGANCEQDDNDILFDFHELVFGEGDSRHVSAQNVTAPVDHENNLQTHIPDTVVVHDQDSCPPLFNIPDIEEQDEDFVDFDNQPVVYVSGFLAKKMLAGITCSRCCEVLQGHDKTDKMYRFISLKEWDDNPRLAYPSIALCSEVKSLTNIFENNIKHLLYIQGIIQYSQNIMLGCLNVSWLCEAHFTGISQNMVQIFSVLLIRNECRKINESISLFEDNSADILKKAQQAGTAK